MKFFLNDKEITPDEEGGCQATCSVCFKETHCIGITYPKIANICQELGVAQYGFAVCQDCLKTDKQTLYINIMDYFVMNELGRWVTGDKHGLVRSQHEFDTLLDVALNQGIIYREEKRIRFRYAKKERQFQHGFVDMLKREKSGNYIPNVLYQNLFKNLYERN